MNKKNIVLSLLCISLLVAASLSFAAFQSQSQKKIMVSVKFTKNVMLTHTHVNRISQFQGEPNFVVVGSYSDNSVTHMEIEYYIDSDSTTISKLPLKEICSPFVSTELTVPAHVTSFSYRFLIITNNNTVDKKYYPHDGSWINVPVTDCCTTTLGSSGGTILLEHGDQRYACTKISINPNSLASDCFIRVVESDINSFSGDKNNLVRLYEINAAHNLTQCAQICMYYGSSNDGKFIVKYYNGNRWQKISSSQTQDAALKTISFDASLAGYYGIFIKADDGDNSHRPEHRVFVLGEKLAFRNLQLGDTVTIIDINGRQVKKLSSHPFEWDGRKSGGGYAESGSYIYQIKTNGKIISGSFVFVK